MCPARVRRCPHCCCSRQRSESAPAPDGVGPIAKSSAQGRPPRQRRHPLPRQCRKPMEHRRPGPSRPFEAVPLRSNDHDPVPGAGRWHRRAGRRTPARDGSSPRGPLGRNVPRPIRVELPDDVAGSVTERSTAGATAALRGPGRGALWPAAGLRTCASRTWRCEAPPEQRPRHRTQPRRAGEGRPRALLPSSFQLSRPIPPSDRPTAPPWLVARTGAGFLG